MDDGVREKGGKFSQFSLLLPSSAKAEGGGSTSEGNFEEELSAASLQRGLKGEAVAGQEVVEILDSKDP